MVVNFAEPPLQIDWECVLPKPSDFCGNLHFSRRGNGGQVSDRLRVNMKVSPNGYNLVSRRLFG
jgi:hypothetical protein